MPVRHVVLFRVHDTVPEDAIVSALGSLGGLSDLAGVIDWRVARSTDERKGRILVEEATFVDRDAFAAFRADARHAAVAGELARIADWWVADYDLP